MGEGGEGGRVGVVVGGHIDGLEGSDGAATGGGDALLELAHLVCEGGLVADCGRHAAQEGGDFGAGLDKAEDVVYEQQHILVLDIAEILGDGHAGETDTEADAGGFIHLAEDQSGFFQNAGFFHLQEEVGAFTGALAYAGENRDAAVLLGYSADHLGD